MNTFFDALLSSMFVCSSYTVMKYKMRVKSLQYSTEKCDVIDKRV